MNHLEDNPAALYLASLQVSWNKSPVYQEIRKDKPDTEFIRAYMEAYFFPSRQKTKKINTLISLLTNK